MYNDDDNDKYINNNILLYCCALADTKAGIARNDIVLERHVVEGGSRHTKYLPTLASGVTSWGADNAHEPPETGAPTWFRAPASHPRHLRLGPIGIHFNYSHLQLRRTGQCVKTESL